MPYRLMFRSTALAVVLALLLVPATFAGAAPAAADTPTSLWEQTWNLFTDLFADWFGEQPTGMERATGSDQIGSLLDPDGYTFTDPNNAQNAEDCDPTLQTCGEIGSLLDPDG
ncbi:MAG TPA: hypothetical protein VKU40_18965 [Thermoanaerobaculia bacterium]|nr:hypothetical protein [Thermoanaerobaculia bacterium]